jgi:sec-independent protein translocase protein TatA
VGLILIPGLPTVGGPELIIFLVIILLLFGAKRIPELAKGLGSGVRQFRRGVRGEDEDEEKRDEEKRDEELAAGEGESPRARGENAARGAERADERSEPAERAERSEQKH